MSFQTGFHIFQAFDIRCAHLGNRNTGHPFYRFCYVVNSSHNLLIVSMLINFFLKFLNAHLFVDRGFVIFFLGIFFLFILGFLYFCFQGLNVGYRMLRCQVSSRYIDKVDGFIRQRPLRDVLHGVIYSCFQNSIWQFNVMVSFVKWTNPHEDLESVFRRWSVNLNFVKTTSQSCVFHDSIPIFILGRSTDNGQFSTRQSWF